MENILASIMALFKDPTAHDDYFIEHRIIRKSELFQSILIMLEELTLEELTYGYDQVLKQIGLCNPIQLMQLVQNQYDNIIDRIIESCLKEKHPEIQNKIIELLEVFLNVVSLTKKNYQTLFTFAKQTLYHDIGNLTLISRILHLLSRCLEIRNHLTVEPYATFYFNSIGSGIVTDCREMTGAFQKGITLQVWLKPARRCNSRILYIRTENGECSFYLQEDKLIYQYGEGHRISVLEIPPDQWSALSIQVKIQNYFYKESYYLYVRCGNQSIQEISIEFPRGKQVINFSLFTDFYGLVSSLLLFNEGYSGNDLACGDIRFGIQSNAHLRTLNKQLDRYAKSLLLLYTPLRTKQNFIIDPINKFDGALQQHSGAFIKQTVHQNLNQFAKLDNFVPLLLFLQPHPTLLNTLLELFGKILRTRTESQKDAVRIELFSLISLKINSDALQYLDNDTIAILSQIKNSLLENKLKEQFVTQLLWRIQIHKLPKEIMSDYLQFVRVVYNSNPEFYARVFGIRQILEIIVFDIDPRNRLCCQEHSSQLGYSPKGTRDFRSLMNEYLNIVEAVLFYQIFDAGNAKEALIAIARMFTQKYSACFYQSLLQLLQKMFGYEKVGLHTLTEVFMQEEILFMLLNLLTTCSCPDVKTSCIKLISESLRLQASPIEMEIAIWVGHTLGNSAQLELSDEQHKKVISYEPLYVAIMEWMLKQKVAKNNADTFLLEESFIIRSLPGLFLLTEYFAFCVHEVRGRIMQDLCMLVKWNSQSADALLHADHFHHWILQHLLQLQVTYNISELTQFQNWIWDSGIKLYALLLKHSLATEANAFQRIQTLHEYLTVLKHDEISGNLLFRIILKQLFQTLGECYRMDLKSKFYDNLPGFLLTIYRIIVTDTTSDFVLNKFNGLNLFQLDAPKRFKQQYGSVPWIDSIFTQNLNDLVNAVCSKMNAALFAPLDDFQMVQKGIQISIEETPLGLFHLMLTSVEDKSLIQILQLWLQLIIEYYALNSQSTEQQRLGQLALQSMDKLMRTFIMVSENSGDQELDESQEKIIYQVLGSHYNFLFTHESCEWIRDHLQFSLKFLIIVVDVIANMLGKFEYQVMIFEANRKSSPPLRMFVIRMLKDLYSSNGSLIFEAKDAKTLKLNNKLIIPRIAVSKDAFTSNATLMQLIDILYYPRQDEVLHLKMQHADSIRGLEMKIKQLHQNAQQMRSDIEQVLFNVMEHNYLNNQSQKIDSEQIYLRRAKYMFKRTFNSVRVFNQWWTHDEFEAQNHEPFNINDLDFDNINHNRIFIWKMWKYETKQKCRPLLKCKLYDYPPNDIEQVESESDNRIMNLVQEEDHPENKPKEKLLDRINPLRIFQQQQLSDELIVNKVQWIKTLTVRCGTLRILEGKLIFYFESISQKETHQSLIKFKVPEDSRLVKEWPLDRIKDVQLRRYIGRLTCLEITMIEGTTLIFNFPQKDHQLLIDRLFQSKKQSPYLKIRQKLDPWSVMQDSKALSKWFSYKITTFEYLMRLNKISGRSHKDLTQYPVFPWIMNDGEQLGRFRDLSKPMGAIGSPERISVFQQRYQMIDHFNKVPQFHYGSHYSSPAIIFHFLIRLKPFSDGAKELQSGKFDLADRLFFSFVDTYRNAVEELSDVRELIPEFFFMPEMFINQSKYDYGLQQTGQRVNNVDLPRWTEQNPYRFIYGHRMQLESDYASQNISSWIDLIFGYKQKREEALNAQNIFYYLTYENSIDWDQITNEKQKISLESQVIHFGQCPSQIFDRPHPVRGKQKFVPRISDEKTNVTIFRQKPLDGSPPIKNDNYRPDRSIIRIQFLSENKIWICRKNGDIQIVKLQNISDAKKIELTWEKEQQIITSKYMDENTYLFDWTSWFDEIPLLNRGKCILIGGIWDGRLIMYSEMMQSETYDDQDSTITVIRQDYKQRILVTGSKTGTVCIYQWAGNKLKLKCKHNSHDGAILDIFICCDLKAVLTSGTDGWVHMYNMWSGKYLRSYRHPQRKPVQKVCIFCTPLYGVALYEHKTIYSYSINGQYLSQYDLPQPITNQAQLKVVKDSQLNDVIAIPLRTDKKILIISTPFLALRTEIKLTPHPQSMKEIQSFAISPERKIIAFGTTDGEFGLGVDLKT